MLMGQIFEAPVKGNPYSTLKNLEMSCPQRTRLNSISCSYVKRGSLLGVENSTWNRDSRAVNRVDLSNAGTGLLHH